MARNTTIEEKRYRAFVKDILKCDFITIDSLWILLNRHTQGYMGRRFFNDSLKLRYYRFWILRAKGSNIIEETETFGLWKVNRVDDKK